MAGKLKKLVDFVRVKSTFTNLTIARISLKIGSDINEFTSATPDEEELEQKLIEAIKDVLKVDSIEI